MFSLDFKVIQLYTLHASWGHKRMFELSEIGKTNKKIRRAFFAGPKYVCTLMCGALQIEKKIIIGSKLKTFL